MSGLPPNPSGIDELDPRKIAESAWPVFAYNRWTYGRTHPNVPTVDELEETVAGLIERVRGFTEDACSATGRFTAWRSTDDGDVAYGVDLGLADTQ